MSGDAALRDLNKSELEVMRVLWEQGPCKPAEIQAAFGWEIENATLRSTLRVLMEKGVVSRRKQGKAFFYRARASREGVLSRTAQMMARVFTGGSTAGLLAQLIKTEKLSAEEIKLLRQVADERSPATPKKGALK